MYKIRLDTSQFKSRLKEDRKKLRDLKPFFLKEGSDIVYREIRKVFLNEGYGSWSALSPKYAAWKSRFYPGKTILRRDDTYFQAATGPNASDSFREATASRLRIGVTGPEYAIYHEEGTQRMPARPVFELAADRLERPLLQSLEQYLFRSR